MFVRRKALHYLRSRLAPDPPSLRIVFWDGQSYDFVDAPRATIRISSPTILKALVRGNFEELARAYVAGEIEAEGPISEVVDAGAGLAESLETLSFLARARGLARFIPFPRSRRKEAADAAYHYNLSNDFYRLWLDDRMIYSCAYFRSGREDIHTAQLQKLDHVCCKLMLRPGDSFLDVGCGWGGLLRWAARCYGARALGVTVSDRQFAYAREQFKAIGAGAAIEVRLDDFRDLKGMQFDKIASVGMYEHVGERNLSDYFRTVSKLLRPGGVFLNHGVVAGASVGRSSGPAGGGFIEKYVFPGGSISPLSRLMAEIPSAGLEIIDVEDLRPHYARTLRLWSQRLEERRDEATRLIGPERYRIWRAYLAGMAYAFERGWLSIAQILACKPLEGHSVSRPWTREYQYDLNPAPPMSGDISTHND
ncbi:class I SAM-dependent methyltransferase [Methylocystis heyeri]|uniref:Methyltransferase domain-containing protein n=1 Tax=Methylocystis heyeri TaxID=391905 RepID=A0A6B8KFC3_9HYPH|nr:class I SAM-dependent methyltransferase [Methylocystis heyeri]QGM47174.1 methyltransferase domain-containing protein [Methylocystis heyeri]